MAVFNLASALAVRGIEGGDLGDVAEGFALFVFLGGPENGSSFHFDRYRPLALVNATILLDLMPHREALKCARQLIEGAVHAFRNAELPLVRLPLLAAVERIEARALAFSVPAEVRWNRDRKADRLMPTCSTARERMTGVRQPLVGPWPGVRSQLSGFGLGAPQACPVEGSVTVHPANGIRALVVTPA